MAEPFVPAVIVIADKPVVAKVVRVNTYHQGRVVSSKAFYVKVALASGSLDRQPPSHVSRLPYLALIVM